MKKIVLTGEFGQVVWTLKPEVEMMMQSLPQGGTEMVEGDVQRYLGRRVSKINAMLKKGDIVALGYTATSEE